MGTNEAACSLYRGAPGESAVSTGLEERLAARFLERLLSQADAMPASEDDRLSAISSAASLVVAERLDSTSEPFAEDAIEVSLRPVRRLSTEQLVSAALDILCAYHRGIWGPHLTRPQLWVIRIALERTVVSLPASALAPLWLGLSAESGEERDGLRLSIGFFCAAHRVDALLSGLERITQHTIRAEIVDCLEQIAEPTAISRLTRLRASTAATDWTLSRQIGRAIRTIEYQNRDNGHRTLLRSVSASGDDGLLRSAGLRNSEESALLLREPTEFG